MAVNSCHGLMLQGYIIMLLGGPGLMALSDVDKEIRALKDMVCVLITDTRLLFFWQPEVGLIEIQCSISTINAMKIQ